MPDGMNWREGNVGAIVSFSLTIAHPVCLATDSSRVPTSWRSCRERGPRGAADVAAGGKLDETHRLIDRRTVVCGSSAGVHETRRRTNTGAGRGGPLWGGRAPGLAGEPLGAERPPGLGLGPATVHAGLCALPRCRWEGKEWAPAGGKVAKPGCGRAEGDQRGDKDAVLQEAAFSHPGQGSRGV